MRFSFTSLRRLALCTALSLIVATSDLGATSQIVPANYQTTVELPMSTISSGKQPRLRRLHLVRPDLIPYPLQSEFVC